MSKYPFLASPIETERLILVKPEMKYTGRMLEIWKNPKMTKLNSVNQITLTEAKNNMKKRINFNKFKIKFLTLNFIVILILNLCLAFILQPMLLPAPAIASGDSEIKSAVKSKSKEVKKNTKNKSAQNAPAKDLNDEIIADEDDEIDIDSGEEKKKTGYSFNYTAESKIEKMSRDRMKDKIFLENIFSAVK